MGLPVIPENICGGCGQPGGIHLSMCPTLAPPEPVAAPAETPEQQEHQHNLGQAI